MARRAKRVDRDNHERWLISYADFVTLLFAFFVVMYAISSVNELKYKSFSDSLSNAFANQPAAAESKRVSNESEQLLKFLVDKRTARLGEQQRKYQERMNKLSANLAQLLGPLIDQHLVGVSSSRRGVVIDVSASLLFNTGEAELQPGALEVLRQVAIVLGAEELPVEVEGHTDDIPIATTQFPSNWELSSARASSVVRMLISNGMPEQRLAVVGLAATQPVAPNDSPENRARNRRVSITLVSPGLDRNGALIE
jgi:chemotaxis protein MotB